MDIFGLAPSHRDVDGMVEIMLNATQNSQSLLTEEPLSNWHASLFQTGRSGMYPIAVGA